MTPTPYGTYLQTWPRRLAFDNPIKDGPYTLLYLLPESRFVFVGFQRR